jgi:hypothetical protein
MATTYSQSIVGIRADYTQETTKIYDIPDASLSGQAMPLPNNSAYGGMQGVMQKGDLVLVQGPDGAQHLYRLDAERSTPTNPILIYVGP